MSLGTVPTLGHVSSGLTWKVGLVSGLNHLGFIILVWSIPGIYRYLLTVFVQVKDFLEAGAKEALTPSDVIAECDITFR
jgi:hypothetical protein